MQHSTHKQTTLMMDNPEGILTAQEASALIGIERDQFYRYMRDGFIAVIRNMDT